MFCPHFMTAAIRTASHLRNEIVLLSFDSCNRRNCGTFSKSIVAELSFTEKQQHSVWVSRSELPVQNVASNQFRKIIVILFGHHGGATGGARDMSKGALAPVGPRVESPLMARVVAMFITMIKAPCKFVGCVCTLGISVQEEWSILNLTMIESMVNLHNPNQNSRQVVSPTSDPECPPFK